VIKNSSVGVYTPFELALKFDDGKTEGVIITTSEEASNCLNTPGPYMPYYGTKTRAKISQHGFEIIRESSTIDDLCKLSIIVSELGSGEDIKELVNTIIKSRCPWDISSLTAVLPGVYGGAALHRHQRVTQAVMSTLGSTTVGTHLNFNTDRTGVFSGGANDYPLPFQASFLTAACNIQCLAYFGLVNSGCSYLVPVPTNPEPIDDTVVGREV